MKKEKRYLSKIKKLFGLQIFLQDKARKMKIKSFSLEKYISSLELIAEELKKDEIDWSEITRKEYDLFSRNSVRGALATVGLTTEIKQSIVISRMIKIMDIDYEILKFSNMNRDIHIGHLLETDREGIGYCSLLALSKQDDTEAIIKNKLKLFLKENNKAA